MSDYNRMSALLGLVGDYVSDEEELQEEAGGEREGKGEDEGEERVEITANQCTIEAVQLQESTTVTIQEDESQSTVQVQLSSLGQAPSQEDPVKSYIYQPPRSSLDKEQRMAKV
jgi:hypothetical protein